MGGEKVCLSIWEVPHYGDAKVQGWILSIYFVWTSIRGGPSQEEPYERPTISRKVFHGILQCNGSQKESGNDRLSSMRAQRLIVVPSNGERSCRRKYQRDVPQSVET
mmetsp:Transcript_25824/g.60028  ORF Transcript_25824/g.60028 Transcript_25824/m.60028 type:complete len:107 (+) Transcript_25824:454-774(+)